jgi:non-ribosomal peptide synthetase component F
LPLQYADFASWQRRFVEAGDADEDLAYWRGELEPPPEPLLLPTDRPRAVTAATDADKWRLVFPAADARAIADAARAQQTTWFTILMAAYAVLLARYIGRRDLIIGVPIAARPAKELAPLIGLFLSTLPIRVRIDPRATAGALVAEVRRAIVGAHRHRNAPIERLQGTTAAARQQQRTSTFHTTFAQQGGRTVMPAPTGLEVDFVHPPALQVRSDLELHAYEWDGELIVSWLYSRALFDRWRIEQMARHYVRIVRAIVADAGRRVGEIDMLDPSERRRLVHG